MSFRILCDSCTDLTPAMAADSRIHRVPLKILVNGLTLVDDGTLSMSDLLWQMKQSADAPATACPSIGDYLDLFACEEEDIYIVTLSALLSGSHNTAMQAASLHREEGGRKNIHVFNSCSAAAGQVAITLKILELAEAGLPFGQVVEMVEAFIARMQTLFVLEDLENLRKNGRLTKMQSIVTSALRVKLLCCATPEGEIAKLSQAFTVKQALSKMIARVALEGSHKGQKLVISHCNCRERAYYVRQLAEDACDFDEVIVTEAGGITTVYANDGGIVIAY